MKAFGGSLWHHLLLGLSGDLVQLHVAAELTRDLLENLLSKVTALGCFVEDHELDDVSWAHLSLAIAEFTSITVQCLHGGEVGIAYTHDNN